MDTIVTELCELALKWGTDKAIFYTPLYHELFANRRDIKKVLEFGIGYPKTMLQSVSRIGITQYTIGASLFMWKEYFPQAHIYALDNKPEIFVNDRRIHCFYCDQRDEESFDEIVPLLGDRFDLIIEDGSHVREDQLRSVNKLMPLLDDNGIYIMEDVSEPYDELLAQITYPCELKTFYRPDLDKESNTAAIVVIRKHVDQPRAV